MNEREKSDSPILPRKLPNKGCGALQPAEGVKRRGLAEKEISDGEYRRIKEENREAVLNSREAAYYFKIFRQFHSQDSILNSIGIWKGFDFEEERQRVQGTLDGDLRHG